MNCTEVKPKMGNYRDGELPENEQQAISSHLQDCSNCLGEHEQLDQIESLVNSKLYDEPPRDYWQQVPLIVTERLGLRSRSNLFDKVADTFSQFLVPKNLGWGLATAVAVLVAFLVAKQMPFDDREIAQVQQTEVFVQKPEESDNVPVNISEEAELSFNAPVEKEQIVATTSKSTEDITFEQPDAFTLNFKIARVGAMPLRYESRELVDFQQELIPLPFPNYIAFANIPESDENSNKTLAYTFALDNTPIPQTEISDEVLKSVESNDVNNEFAEIMLIVHQSNSFSEQRNILLSYLTRENDSTYRSMAVFELALILKQIAEESNQSEAAKEALEFFKENERSLRFQMKARYDRSIHSLKSILNKE